ncbi:DUF4149 domain-containing protein [Halorussus gelatinilyticus]|uniref:DUF4149 domain-containing protein n=1 Tax=Halorussus gelatinilyticus TaxID=2937524 RepID=A0A8U0IGD5_9EURY|nr:DUF4149 domain-containing protein [Halorussus gelatinilyticus]UPV99760.1 DUF4149 domain-containing protein [Halorussus gelatinilyticus]
MSLLETALATLLDASLGVWLGSIVFFSLVGAPTTFDVLGDDAGRVVNAIFPKYYSFGAILGLVAVAAALVVGVGPYDGVLLAALPLVGVALNLYARQVLIPKMDRAGDDGFAKYHKQSVALNGATIFAVAAGLVVSHLQVALYF